MHEVRLHHRHESGTSGSATRSPRRTSSDRDPEGWSLLEAVSVEHRWGPGDALRYIKDQVEGAEQAADRDASAAPPAADQDMYFKGAMFLNTCARSSTTKRSGGRP